MQNLAAGEGAFGGGIGIYGYTVTIERCWIAGNSSTSRGGGVSANDSEGKAVIRDTVISGNVAKKTGSAIQSWSQETLFELTNVTISGNRTMGDRSAAIHLGEKGRLVARNSIVWGNGPSFTGDRISCMWTNCLIEGSGGSEKWKDYYRTDGGGNIDVDPGFVEPLDFEEAPSLAGDFRLNDDSPAAGAGDPHSTDSTEDLSKAPRVMGAGIELGAYEIFEEAPAVAVAEPQDHSWMAGLAVGAVVLGFGIWMVSWRKTSGERREILRMQEDFEKIQERQKSFASETSHELRTPIAVILSHCELALAENRQPDQIREAVKACQRAGVRMKSLTDDLLEISKMENGAVEFPLTPCSLREVAEDALDLVESVADRKGVSLVDEVDHLTLMANGDRLWQVMVNLLNNAVRHTPEGKVVRLHAVEADDEVVLSVIDQGEGIPAEEIPHLFKRFYKGGGGESGLGLAICEMIVKAHHGTLTVESEPGVETRFVARIPKGRESE